MKDSISKRGNIARSDELEAINKYLNAKSQNSLLLKNLEFKETQRNYLILISLLLMITFFVIFWRYRAKKGANKKLSELNAMKDLLFGIVAHDLKNPFLSILGATDLLLKELDNMSKDEIREIIELIETSGKHTYNLLENLLYWSLSQTDNIQYAPEKISLPEIVNETILLLANSAQTKSITLSSHSPEDFVALCDKEMIKLVLRNLISNGIKYTQEGGLVEVSLKKNSGFIEVSVKDSGVGIDAERKESLMMIDRHSSTAGTKGEKGTGLGLFLCKDFVERNKGNLVIESEVGKGSRFVFTLPATS